MELSIAGLIVFVFLLLVSRSLGGLPVALMASLAFGATSLISLTALGGSSPLVYTFVQILLICTVALKRSFLQDLRSHFSEEPVAWVILLFAAYVVVGAVLLPRLFAGQTSAFVPVRPEGRIAEVPLFPTSGNITQSLYFILDVLTFFAFSIGLRRGTISLTAVRNGLFFWAILLIGFGVTDLGAKLSGAGDILEPLRSASYAMLTSAEENGFFRIVGPYSEASAFGAATVYVLAFTFSYWRATRNSFALVLSIPLLALLALSTSSTAYVAVTVISIPLFLAILKSSLGGRILRQDLFVLCCGIAMILLFISVTLYKPGILDPFWDLLNSMVLNKATSASAQERMYWNVRSLQSFWDSGGLGIGLGSSRASSWPVAVASQLGIVGALILGYLTFEILRAGILRGRYAIDYESRAIAHSLRTCCLAILICSSISGGAAAPGFVFFVTLAVIREIKKRAPRSLAINKVAGSKHDFGAPPYRTA